MSTEIVRRIKVDFDDLESVALPPEASTELIAAVAKEWSAMRSAEKPPSPRRRESTRSGEATNRVDVAVVESPDRSCAR
ncbi:hypothetical protein GCM10010151_50040 [Actinoallomurus spadix]|uniref:Uncharacterized protein n=1 Tax=Actinoallomurus spadix TaxID=79912 RepID=A0ABP3GWD6_9ACTN